MTYIERIQEIGKTKMITIEVDTEKLPFSDEALRERSSVLRRVINSMIDLIRENVSLSARIEERTLYIIVEIAGVTIISRSVNL